MVTIFTPKITFSLLNLAMVLTSICVSIVQLILYCTTSQEYIIFNVLEASNKEFHYITEGVIAVLEIIMYSFAFINNLLTKWDPNIIFHNYSCSMDISEAEFIAKGYFQLESSRVQMRFVIKKKNFPLKYIKRKWLWNAWLIRKYYSKNSSIQRNVCSYCTTININ